MMTILGLHHITLGCSHAQRTVDFYTRILGLRFVKKTVNFDDPGSYHLYFGDEVGRPGTAITFFEWAGVPPGRPGIGGTHHLAWRVEEAASVRRWARRLADAGARVEGPYEVGDNLAVQVRDPDGVILEIIAAKDGPGEAGPVWPDPVPEIDGAMALRQGMDHWAGECSDLGRTRAFYGDLLGMPLMERQGGHGGLEGRSWAWRAGSAGGHVVFVQSDVRARPRAKIGVGQTHHFALAVADAGAQLAWRERLVGAGLSVTPVLDRVYFQSIYTRDPDGHIVELATLGPGFTVDESAEDLGSSLRLPPWLEDDRAQIERRMRPVAAPEWRGWPGPQP